ncbi:hypothetical protein [Deinococcus sp. DB0503]|uniref:hypothetical protein n=1 Tax=Deinococcus sp. DB0503 TaxID=2479203 RepID=UPI0018E02689|nr:hypothetical protein [Deinococcus sp. DB0503]MBI0446999.1 hypothetical protein [Deinococcus sp. DB0503]
MTQPEAQKYIYDPEVRDTLAGEVEALGLEIPRDPNSPGYESFIEQLRAKDPRLATRLSLARIPEAELHASRLLQEQARAIDGRESFMERLTARVTRKTPNGTPVPDLRRLGIVGGGVLIALLGAFLFWPRPPRAVAATSATTTATTPPGDTEAGSTTGTTRAPSPPPTESAVTAPLPQAPVSSSGSTSGVGEGQTVAPTESQLSTPSSTPPAYAKDASSGDTPPSSAAVYTPPPALDSSGVSTPPPAVSSMEPDTTAAPGAVFSPPAASASVVTTAPDWGSASPPPVTVPPADAPPAQVTENFAGSQPNSASTSPATVAGATSPSGTARGANSRLSVVYTAASGQPGEAARTGRMTVISGNGADTGSDAAFPRAGSAQGPEGTGNPAGESRSTRSRNLSVIYDGQATNRPTSSGPGQNQNSGQADARTQVPQNGQPAPTATTSPTQDAPSKVLYSAAEPAGAAPATQGNGENGQASLTVPASGSPFQMGQLIPAKMAVALELIEGASMEFFTVTPADRGAYIWKGTATLDSAKRVQMNFTELALPDGQVIPVRASGVAQDGTLGVKSSFRPSAPAAAIDAVRGTLSGIQEAASAQLQAGTAVVGNGVTVVTKAPPNFWLSLAGGAVNSFKLPATTTSVVTLARIERGTPINILFGGSGSAAGDGTTR